MAVHPRVRGEHLDTPSVCARPAGSSPRPRGTPGYFASTEGTIRFIPASAGNTPAPPSGSPRGAVHPRVRGEHVPDSTLSSIVIGSSPRPRGTRHRCGRRHGGRRFIPASAGNTRPTRPRRSSSSVHPRVRGEHGACRRPSGARRGSSPRPRGTQRHRLGPRPAQWFIPASAGNTARRRSTRPTRPVHPRVRGEHLGTSVGTGLASGSSPRPRGTHRRDRGRTHPDRFIPASAGNTCRAPPARARSTVHPRVRGEHTAQRPVVRLDRRFIPASAGNTCGSSRWRRSTPVHPRVRGEHSATLGPGIRDAGSSPRPRGTLAPTSSLGRGLRFIPASAGNTRPSARRRSRSPVHPRVRGEHQVRQRILDYADGSSPRPRGTRDHRHLERRQRRFIPASAGNTPKPVTSALAPAGSSPRPRGTLNSRSDRSDGRRFIPASAGNTRPVPCARRAPPVHPRVRGEHIGGSDFRQGRSGSSPRPRGTPATNQSRSVSRRFIPASAGNTHLVERFIPASAGNTASGRDRRFIPASAGNTQASTVGRLHAYRFIPASAGNTRGVDAA